MNEEKVAKNVFFYPNYLSSSSFATLFSSFPLPAKAAQEDFCASTLKTASLSSTISLSQLNQNIGEISSNLGASMISHVKNVSSSVSNNRENAQSKNEIYESLERKKEIFVENELHTNFVQNENAVEESVRDEGDTKNKSKNIKKTTIFSPDSKSLYRNNLNNKLQKVSEVLNDSHRDHEKIKKEYCFLKKDNDSDNFIHAERLQNSNFSFDFFRNKFDLSLSREKNGLLRTCNKLFSIENEKTKNCHSPLGQHTTLSSFSTETPACCLPILHHQENKSNHFSEVFSENNKILSSNLTSLCKNEVNKEDHKDVSYFVKNDNIFSCFACSGANSLRSEVVPITSSSQDSNLKSLNQKNSDKINNENSFSLPSNDKKDEIYNKKQETSCENKELDRTIIEEIEFEKQKLLFSCEKTCLNNDTGFKPTKRLEYPQKIKGRNDDQIAIPRSKKKVRKTFENMCENEYGKNGAIMKNKTGLKLHSAEDNNRHINFKNVINSDINGKIKINEEKKAELDKNNAKMHVLNNESKKLEIESEYEQPQKFDNFNEEKQSKNFLDDIKNEIKYNWNNWKLYNNCIRKMWINQLYDLSHLPPVQEESDKDSSIMSKNSTNIKNFNANSNNEKNDSNISLCHRFHSTSNTNANNKKKNIKNSELEGDKIETRIPGRRQLPEHQKLSDAEQLSTWRSFSTNNEVCKDKNLSCISDGATKSPNNYFHSKYLNCSKIPQSPVEVLYKHTSCPPSSSEDKISLSFVRTLNSNNSSQRSPYISPVKPVFIERLSAESSTTENSDCAQWNENFYDEKKVLFGKNKYFINCLSGPDIIQKQNSATKDLYSKAFKSEVHENKKEIITANHNFTKEDVINKDFCFMNHHNNKFNNNDNSCNINENEKIGLEAKELLFGKNQKNKLLETFLMNDSTLKDKRQINKKETNNISVKSKIRKKVFNFNTDKNNKENSINLRGSSVESIKVNNFSEFKYPFQSKEMCSFTQCTARGKISSESNFNNACFDTSVKREDQSDFGTSTYYGDFLKKTQDEQTSIIKEKKKTHNSNYLSSKSKLSDEKTIFGEQKCMGNVNATDNFKNELMYCSEEFSNKKKDESYNFNCFLTADDICTSPLASVKSSPDLSSVSLEVVSMDFPGQKSGHTFSSFVSNNSRNNVTFSPGKYLIKQSTGKEVNSKIICPPSVFSNLCTSSSTIVSSVLSAFPSYSKRVVNKNVKTQNCVKDSCLFSFYYDNENNILTQNKTHIGKNETSDHNETRQHSFFDNNNNGDKRNNNFYYYNNNINNNSDRNNSNNNNNSISSNNDNNSNSSNNDNSSNNSNNNNNNSNNDNNGNNSNNNNNNNNNSINDNIYNSYCFSLSCRKKNKNLLSKEDVEEILYGFKNKNNSLLYNDSKNNNLMVEKKNILAEVKENENVLEKENILENSTSVLPFPTASFLQCIFCSENILKENNKLAQNTNESYIFCNTNQNMHKSLSTASEKPDEIQDASSFKANDYFNRKNSLKYNYNNENMKTKSSQNMKDVQENKENYNENDLFSSILFTNSSSSSSFLSSIILRRKKLPPLKLLKPLDNCSHELTSEINEEYQEKNTFDNFEAENGRKNMNIPCEPSPTTTIQPSPSVSATARSIQRTESTSSFSTKIITYEKPEEKTVKMKKGSKKFSEFYKFAPTTPVLPKPLKGEKAMTTSEQENKLKEQKELKEEKKSASLINKSSSSSYIYERKDVNDLEYNDYASMCIIDGICKCRTMIINAKNICTSSNSEIAEESNKTQYNINSNEKGKTSSINSSSSSSLSTYNSPFLFPNGYAKIRVNEEGNLVLKRCVECKGWPELLLLHEKQSDDPTEKVLAPNGNWLSYKPLLIHAFIPLSLLNNN